MSDLISSFSGVEQLPALISPEALKADVGELPFAELVQSLVQDTSDEQAQISESVRQLVTGESDSINDVVMNASQADLAFRLVMEIRNKLISSYEEVMRMQI